MAQNRISINGYDEVQPTAFDYSWETTSTEDSGRTMSGKMYDTPMFTVEAFEVAYEDLTIAQCSTILKRIVKKPKSPYINVHYFSPYYGAWRDGVFGVSQGSVKIQTLERKGERISDLSFRIVGREKLV
jgi:hypothetical protein